MGADSAKKPTIVGSDMSEKMEEAEPPITVQTENVHEAVGQDNADQDGHDDHAATAAW